MVIFFLFTIVEVWEFFLWFLHLFLVFANTFFWSFFRRLCGVFLVAFIRVIYLDHFFRDNDQSLFSFVFTYHLLGFLRGDGYEILEGKVAVEDKRVDGIFTLKEVVRSFAFHALLLKDSTMVDDFKQECKVQTYIRVHRHAFGCYPVDNKVMWWLNINPEVILTIVLFCVLILTS